MLAVVGLIVYLIQRRAPRLGREPEREATHSTPLEPSSLERSAAEAEENGDFELAVRLRFRAGLLRLEQRGLLAGREVRTSRDIGRELRSPTFDRLADDIELIVYAKGPAEQSHARTSRELWPRAIDEAESRR
ncbi:MAG TPA: hypothetical protein VGS21_02870 [Acidimicrobiales bacterium]|nr:hypothetical protein [Acidimicrobiales bacterium]